MKTTKKLLIVDDDAFVQESFQEFFSDQGFQVVVAATQAEGIDIARDQQPDVILADLVLGTGSGLALLEEVLHSWPAGVAPPVFVVMTGYGTLGNAMEAMRLDAAGFLMKPLHLVSVLNLILCEMKKRDGLNSLREDLERLKGVWEGLGPAQGRRDLEPVLRSMENSVASLLERPAG